ncbi:acyltransferase family protein [Rosenbergiella epipactidis]|uniref:acyltransferase family protein n=1 Tax=Rosenbergiella epipactidis TaxID=1544694 RepID=UPI001F4DCE92|nr:acyltransferase family protein [Rosenbergiella epipactidis]
MQNYKPESDWVAISKGIAIFSVIAGHIFVGPVSKAIFLFHMPFFFFLSGLLFKPRSQKLLATNKAKTQIIPYVKYLFLFFLVLIIQKELNNTLTYTVFFKDLAKQILGGRWLTHVQSVFWFIPVFFMSQQTLNFMLNNYSMNACKLIIAIMLLLAYIDSIFFKIQLPLNITTVLYTTPIMFVGYIMKGFIDRVNSILLCSLSLLGLFLVESYPSLFSIDLKFAEYGFPLFSFIVSISISILLIKISKTSILNNKYIIFLGNSSMSIMFIHQFFRFDIFSRFLSSNILIFLATLAASVIYSYFMMLLSQKTKAYS